VLNAIVAAALWNHVSQPFTVDSAGVNIVISEVSRVASDVGIRSSVAISDKRGNHHPWAEVRPVNFSKYLDRDGLLLRERFEDSFRGWARLERRNMDRMYRSVGEALVGSEGPIIVHDGYLGAAALETLHRMHPDRHLFLWMHNKLSPAYSPREVRRFVGLADKVICVSDFIRGSVRKAARSDSIDDRLVTVLNGVDSDRFTPLKERDAERVPSILFVGRMLKIKGPDTLAAALGDLHAQGVDFRATFMGISHPDVTGASKYERMLRTQTAAFSDKVSFVAFRPNSELPSIYRDHDILVVPSRYHDPCPLVLLEGMASGVAVVAARRGGMPEVGEGSVQFFDKQEGLTSALRALLQDAQLRSHWGGLARVRAEQLTWSRTFEGVRDLLSPA
jgi:glycosyltransferase involved in cell wall biosynthesis